MGMRILVVFLILGPTTLFGQATYEIGGFGGVSYYIGELNPVGHFKPALTHRAFGGYFRQALNSRWALRYGFNYGKISGNDTYSTSVFNQNRNLSFESKLYEGNFLIEFNFLHYHSFVYKDFFSPYIFGGVGLVRFNPFASLNGNLYELHQIDTEPNGSFYLRTVLSFPFGFGVKFKFSHRILFALETGIRKSASDRMDDVSGFYPDPANLDNIAVGLSNKSGGAADWGSQRGNPNDRDWYSFSGLQVSIRLGKNPRLCHYKPE